MVRKLRIGIDLDATLNNMEEKWVHRYNSDYNDNLLEWVNWAVELDVKPECGVKIFNYLKEPNFFEDSGIKPNAKDVVSWMNNHFELYIVTAYSDYQCKGKIAWVEKELPFFPKENVIFINNKSLLNLDYLIDDAPHNIINFGGNVIIFDKLYNRHIEESDTKKRLNDWSEIKSFFEKKIYL